LISIFRNNTPLAIGLLLLLAIVPEINPHPSASMLNNSQHTIVWNWIYTFSEWINFNTSFLGILIRVSVTLICALYINKIVTDHKLMEKPGYLPAMWFLLLQSLIPKQVSLDILVMNVFMIASVKLMILVYKLEKPINSLLTASFMLSLIALINATSVIYFLWLSAALLIMRPASFREWIMVLTGYLLPIYLLTSILYLANRLDFSLIFSFQKIEFGLPVLSPIEWIRIAIVWLTPWLFFMLSANQISKLLIQGRKAFIICLLLSIVVSSLIVSNLTSVSQNMHLSLLPATLLISPLFIHVRKKLLPNLFILILLVLSQLR
jgi:hypothetical protein